MKESNVKFGVLIFVMAILVWCIPVAGAENTVNQTNASEPYYITIDPIGNVTQGDVFIVHGTTNVPSPEVLSGWIFSAIYIPGGRVGMPNVSLGAISHESTPSGIILWSVNVTDHWGDLPISWSPYTIYIIYDANLMAHQDFTVLPSTNATRTSTSAIITHIQTPVQTSVISTSTPAQSSPVPFVLPIVAISMLVVICSIFRKKGE